MTVVDQVEVYDTQDDMLCGAKTKQGRDCARPAGWGTWHPGRGRCKLHGGASPAGPYSKYLDKDIGLADRIAELKSDPELLSLNTHLAAIIAHLERLVKDDKADVNVISQVVDRISKIKEREVKIQSGYWLTPEQQTAWLKALIGVINQEIDDEPTKRRIAERMAALPALKP